LRDNVLQLSGLATKQETAEALRGDLRSGIPESFKISEQIKFREPTIKPVSPYTMTIVVEDAIVRLTGYVPSEAVRTSLVGTIRSRLGERKLSDGLELGAGAPEGWQACAAAGLQGLAKLGKGRIDLVNRSLKFAAVTDDEDVAEAVRGEVRAAANRACDPEFEIVVNAPPEPNIDWHAVLTANELLLEGEVPDEAIRIDLAQSAAKLFPKAKVIDQTVVKAAYSKKWPRVAGLGLRVLSKLRAGEVHLEGAELFVSGQAPDTAIATAVRQQLRDLPKGYSGRDAIEVRSDAMIWAEQEAKKKAEAEARRKVEQERRKEEEDTKKPADQPLTERAPEARHASVPSEPVQPVQAATAPVETPSARVDIQPSAEQKQQAALSPEGGNDATCRQALGDTGDHGVIRFDRASSDLSSESISKLNRLAEAAGVCAKLSITIEGHADAEGTPERNQSLSERRAAAVVEYLANRGVPAERLSAVGYGATRPLAPNTTAETRALNRRVEFTLKVN
jgi:outer membrane protein OmpA-like peptidoglycan-associated protein